MTTRGRFGFTSFFRSARAARRPLVLIAAAVVAAEAGVTVAGCDSTTPEAEGTDAATESSAQADAQKDGPVTTTDGGRDVTTCDMPVKGDCDLILQNCPNDSKGKQQECIVGGTASAPKTECVPVQPTQQLPMGRGCCPNNAEGNPCLPGLTCVGRPCEDGGPVTGRCSPACCKGNDQACGASDPEGISGACDLTLVAEGDKPLHDVCSYRERCKPFKVEPCKPGQICLVEDKLGTASCLSSFGKTNRQPCTFANECADGLICTGSGDAGMCRTLCLTPSSTHPFDASVEEGGPGRGGCPVGEECRIGFADLPAWLSACSYPDGG